MSDSSNQTAGVGAGYARNFREERQLWREQTLRGLALSTLVAAAFAAVWFQLAPYGVPRFNQTLWVLVAGLGTLMALRRRVRFSLRAGGFLLLLSAACLVATLQTGLNPNGLVGYAAVAVAAALLLGSRQALGVVIAATLAILGVCAGHSSGLLEQAPNWVTFMDSSRFSNGARAAGIFALLAGSIVVGLSYLLRRTEGLVSEQALAFEALREEQRDKERLRRDLELREAALLKARELETLGRLAGSMAHDFNNALLVIWAAVDELREDAELSDAQEEALTALRSAADQAAATTRNLRAFGRLEPHRPSVLALTSVVDRARATLQRVLPSNIALESAVEVDVSVAADEGELLRMLTNLVLNARDAMREGGTVTLRVRSVEGGEGAARVALEVADTGTGIPEDVMQHLFEPFFTTKEAAGTGLGLATVRDMARKIGGDVQIQSKLGQGTTITLLLPTAEHGAQNGARSILAASGENRVVLVVDDEPAALATLTRYLTRRGFTVLQASGATEGMEVLRRGKTPIHVLCTDGLMSGRPVRHLIEEFRRLHGGAVLVCSGYSPDETGISLQGIDDFLTKPFSGDELVRRIHGVFAARAGNHPAVSRAEQAG
ncbi:MAG TPA: ATP-binding protein [Polyangiaceae bacterium]|nr:ATP-binding protein [Polyangiaceae bacterium]